MDDIMMVVGKWSCWHVLWFFFYLSRIITFIFLLIFFTSTKGYTLPFYLSFFFLLQVMLFQDYHCQFCWIPCNWWCDLPNSRFVFIILQLSVEYSFCGSDFVFALSIYSIHLFSMDCLKIAFPLLSTPMVL